jgi:outer membrane receptor protein involved in Fe transport
VDGGADWNDSRAGGVSIRSYLSTQTYDQTFSSIALNRNSETLTRVQRVPAQAVGLMVQWAREIDKHDLVGGFEAREVRGASDEIAYDRGNPSSFVDAGGRQRSFGLFLRDSFQFNSKCSLAGGTRVDFFKTLRGMNVSRGISPVSPHTTIQLSDSSEFSLSPHVSVLYTPDEKLQLFGSIHRAFREPTLNELYRSFRLGNVLTLANENLRRERSSGVETGVRLWLWQEKFDLRATLFSTTITDPIANVTLTNSPILITRQRQNLGRTNSRGVEVDTSLHLTPRWMISIGYLLSDSKVISFPANRFLEGLMIPQTPRHSFTFQSSYRSSKHYKFGLQGRIAGSQFEDDQNVLLLRGFLALDAYVSRSFDNHLELFLASENLLNSRYEVGRTPVTTLGPPALFRIGLQARY